MAIRPATSPLLQNGVMTTTIPTDYVHLLEEPNYGALGTIRPDGTVQVNPMWFEFDGTVLRFTHTTKRAKYRNLQANKTMSLMVIDPANPFRYIEVRGSLIDVTPDPAADFYVTLGKRYGNPDQQAPGDKADRVILTMSVEHTTQQ
jgi:PPOX class probable F420-dependent enzyme